MAARVILRHVPEWFGDREPFVRAEVQRTVQRFLGRAAAENLRSEVESAPLDRLVSVWNRIPYVQSSDELFDPKWSLGVEPLSMRDLLRAGFERPLKCGLFLELPFRSSSTSRTALLAAVPWLELMKDKETLLTNLLHRGWLLFRCPNRGRATQLQVQVRNSLLRCAVYGSE
ncbi:MAG: hypothetical protein ABUT39_08535 [Acidobacteriota bacterium]